MTSHIPVRLSAGILAVLLLCVATPSRAEVVEATLYPNSARVEEALMLKATDDGVEWTIPLAADPQTLRVDARTEGVELVDVQWEKIPASPPPEAENLRSELNATRTRLAEVQGGLEAIATQLQFWNDLPEFKPEAAMELERTATAMGREISRLVAERHPLTEEKKELEKTVADLEAKLNDLTGQAKDRWLVKAMLDGVTYGSEVELSAAYILSGCGWEPLYRLDARPVKAAVEFGFDARMWQSSGEDWIDVDLELATVRPELGLEPPYLPDWVIQEQPEEQPAMRKQMLGAGQDEMVAMEAAPMAARTPMPQRKASYTVWGMGRRTLPAGAKPRLSVMEESWPATFLYTVRPSMNDMAFLTAGVDLPQARDLPPGPALFMADGAVVGNRTFTLGEREADIYFGADPLVTAEMTLEAKQAGDAGIISTKQTYLWDWNIEVRNGEKHEAAIRVEEPAPQVRNENIGLEISSEPEANKTEEQLLVWEKTLPPGGTWTIDHTVSLKAPANMDLDLGFRR
ncbi:MAG: mucoidy inhibitor MuiA family protein [Oceanidesulfovibrio sp.]